MTKAAHDHMMNLLIKFDNEMQKDIMQRINILLNDDKIKAIDNIRHKLNITHNVAESYYLKAKNNKTLKDVVLLDPDMWLKNQDKMRKHIGNCKG